jgi:hypothetical protein
MIKKFKLGSTEKVDSTQGLVVLCSIRVIVLTPYQFFTNSVAFFFASTAGGLRHILRNWRIIHTTSADPKMIRGFSGHDW